MRRFRVQVAPLAIFVMLTGALACANPAPPREGNLAVPGGRIFYARMGDGPGTPLIVIHGGPGAGSYSLKPFARSSIRPSRAR